MPSLASPNWAENTRFYIVIALMAACFLWGGGSRNDIPGLIMLQPFAVLCIVAVVLLPGPIRWAAARMPLVLLAALGIILAVQLIPLPPSIWAALPGHGQLAPFNLPPGGNAPWRPLSLAPDLTLASLVGLVVPAAALIGLAGLPEGRTHRILTWLLIGAGLGALLGIAQLLGGPNSAFYRYAVTNSDAAVGFFSNRNHQAIFLVTVWPMLAVWARQPVGKPDERRFRRWTAGAAAIALVPMITVTGSRAGLVLAVLGLAIAWWLGRVPASATAGGSGRQGVLWKTLPLAAGATLLAVAILLSRAEAIERLLATSAADESRLTYLPVLTDIAADFFPFGTGFGTFDPVFRFYEPDWALKPTYLNHAHNDAFELVITGGLPAGLIAAVFLIWVVQRVRAAASRPVTLASRRMALLGGSIVLLVMIGSVVDYPLRTPLIAMLLALACIWLAGAGERSTSRKD